MADETENARQASLAQLRLGAGFREDERDRVVDLLGKLERRLANFPADATDLELSVKDRDQPDQKVTLEARLPHFGHIVATSRQEDLRDALNEVREDLFRQIDEAINRRKQGVR